jgi:hypothetical protein
MNKMTGIININFPEWFVVHKIPRDWINVLLKEKIKLPVYNFFIKSDAPISCFEREAIEICRRYLEVTDRNWWPTLLGQSEIMDSILDEEFKK